MARPQYQRRPTGLAQADGEFYRVEQALGQLGPLAGNLDVITKTLVAGNNQVPHGLGRVPIGRIILYVSAATSLYDVTADTVYWTVNASAGATVKFLFV